MATLQLSKRGRLSGNAQIFLGCSALVFFISGMAKLVSLSSRALILNQPDSLLLVSNRTLFAVLGITELAFAVFLGFKLWMRFKLFLVFLFSANFLFYRLALKVIGGPSACPCLGNATDWWPWLAKNQGWLLPTTALSMLIGSLCFLFNHNSSSTRAVEY